MAQAKCAAHFELGGVSGGRSTIHYLGRSGGQRQLQRWPNRNVSALSVRQRRWQKALQQRHSLRPQLYPQNAGRNLQRQTAAGRRSGPPNKRSERPVQGRERKRELRLLRACLENRDNI